MSKLWIYGDSLATDYTRTVAGIDGKTWYEYLSQELNLDISNHAKNGHGVLSTINQILTTNNQWNDDDLIIIIVPDFFRIDIPQVDNVITISDLQTDINSNKLTQISKDIESNGTEWVEENSLKLWNGLVSLLQNRKNIFNFFVHKKEQAKSPHLLYDGDLIDWILKTESYISIDDKHFSPNGAKRFYEYILKKINYVKN